MSILSQAKKPSGKSPLIVTIYGPAGCGKTSLAATFPDPFIIRTQGESIPRDVGEESMPTGLAPIGGRTVDFNGKHVWDENELWEQLTALIREDHEFKTLIVDSASGLEDLFIQLVVDTDPKNPKSIVQAAGGYGAGRATVRAKHSRVRKAAEILRDRKGMHVVFIGHVEVDRLDPPDGDPYSAYSMQLHKESVPIYVNNSDVVAFMKQEMFIVGDDGQKKAKATGNRVISVELNPASVSKNRLGISGDIRVTKGTNPFEEYL